MPPGPTRPFRPPGFRRIRRALRLGLLVAGGLAAASLRAAAPPPAGAPGAEAPPKAAVSSSAACLECHDDHTLTMQRAGKVVALYVDRAGLAASAHRSLDCVDCHEGFDPEAVPHRRPMTPVDCASCHEDVGRKHAFHPRLAQTGAKTGDDTACAGCHGSHAVTAVKSPESPFARSRQAPACGRCHQAAQDQFAASAHGRALAAGAAEAPDCLDCHRHPVARPGPGAAPLALKLAQVALCESCHLEKPAVAGHTLLGTRFVSSFETSAHGAALRRGLAGAANCVDCHGSHQMNQASVAGSRVSKALLLQTCAPCHRAPAAEYAASIHAVARRDGNLDSPVCTDCHGEHAILGRANPASPVNAHNVAEEVCASCHASPRLTRKYGLAPDAVRTFADSYHGLAARGGAATVVTCASCHRTHAIKAPSDPTSSVNPDNLVATCGQCHPGANRRFTIGRVHASPTQRQASPVLYWIASIYTGLILIVIGGMTLHNLADFARKLLRKLAQQKGELPPEPAPHRLYLRMTAHERLQHAALALSFILLVVTGFMLRYPDAGWVEAIRDLSRGAFTARSLLHRFGGVVMLAAGVWHIGYLLFSPAGRSLFRELLPAWRDLTDPWKVLRYNLGLTREKPRFGRFSYIEKAEYWALIWGALLMGATGAVLWFENTSMGLLTKLGFDIARTIHFYEAVLATLAILVWHLYFVIFNPDVYPMNLAWLTGRVSEHEMREEHPLELERQQQEEARTGRGARPEPPEI